MRLVNQTTIIVVALCHKTVGDLRLRRTIALNLMKWLRFSLVNKQIWYAYDYAICRSLTDGVPDPTVELGLHFLSCPYNTELSNC